MDRWRSGEIWGRSRLEQRRVGGGGDEARAVGQLRLTVRQQPTEGRGQQSRLIQKDTTVVSAAGQAPIWRSGARAPRRHTGRRCTPSSTSSSPASAARTASACAHVVLPCASVARRCSSSRAPAEIEGEIEVQIEVQIEGEIEVQIEAQIEAGDAEKVEIAREMRRAHVLVAVHG